MSDRTRDLLDQSGNESDQRDVVWGRVIRPMWPMADELSDDELRRRLTELGVKPGPITESTRPLYLSRLRALTSPGGSQNASNGVHPSPPRSSPSSGPSHANERVLPPRPRPVQVVAAVQQPTSPTHPPPLSTAMTPHSPAASPTVKGEGAQAVVTQLLSSLNDHAHLASDTAFLFPAGDVILASRSILAARCRQMVPILYSREEPYVVNVSTLSGSVVSVFVRAEELVRDLKEKVSLCHGTPVREQRLVFMDCELQNEQTLGSCGITAGTTLHLVLVAPPATTPGGLPTTYFTSVVNPSLSISHLTLGLGLDQLTPPQTAPHHRPARLPLPPHIAHIVHVYDVPLDGFRAFVKYLYSGELAWDDDSTALACCVCCYVLAEAFHLPSLSHTGLQQVSRLLTVDSALLLVQFAEALGSPALRSLCIEYMEAQQRSQN